MAMIVGLTGGVASGKSLVEKQFRALGVPVIDADQVARDVVAPGQPALADIRARFGAEMLTADGQLDRRRMRTLVFADPAARRQLEAITHPAIRDRLHQWREALTAPYGVLSAAILVESELANLADRILVVDAPESMQLTRLMQRDEVPETLARGMIAAQASRAERLARADDILRNDGEPAPVVQAVARLHEHYLALAAGAGAAEKGLRLP